MALIDQLRDSISSARENRTHGERASIAAGGASLGERPPAPPPPPPSYGASPRSEPSSGGPSDSRWRIAAAEASTAAADMAARLDEAEKKARNWKIAFWAAVGCLVLCSTAGPEEQAEEHNS